MARCFEGGEAELTDVASGVFDVPDASDEPDKQARKCTPPELAKLRAQYEKDSAEKAAQKRQESEQMAKLFGLPGSDDASNRRFAANLMKYQGWRSVAYKGKGVFDDDYHV